MFDNLVTRCTIAYQIRQSVCFYIVFYSEYSERNFMMNVKLLTDFFFSNRTILTLISVSMSCVAALLMPVFAIVRFVSTLPMAVVFTGSYTHFTHPIICAYFRTKVVHSNMRWASIKLFIAKQTDSFKSIVLWMLRAVFSVFFLINSKTGHCAECFPKPFYSIWFTFNKSSAYFARNSYKLSAGCISTFKRTIFLLRMTTRRLEFHPAFKARFWEYYSTRFISTINRTKTNNSVGSLFNLRVTISTSFHTLL